VAIRKTREDLADSLHAMLYDQGRLDALVWALTELSENRRPPGGLFMSVNL
jgi:hypothetical protein